MDDQQFVVLVQTHITSPDYLVLQYWVHSMFFFTLTLLIQQGYMSIIILGFLGGK